MRELDRLLDLRLHFGSSIRSSRARSASFCSTSHLAISLIGIALGLPQLLFLLGAVVLAVHVADVVALVAVGVAQEEGRTFARGGRDRRCPWPSHGPSARPARRRCWPGNAEAGGPRHDVAGERLRVVRVLVVEVVLADVDHGQLPQRGHVHDFVEQALSHRAVAEEADRDPVGLQALGGERRAGGDSRAAADDGVRAEVAGVRVGDVHRAALAFAVARFLAQQFGEHPVELRPLGEAVPVAAMRAGDVVVGP